MKYLVIFSLICLLASNVFATEQYLKDVPEGHWATDAVYELVRMGITAGYPDGTFRGKKDISRYEIASFLSKFANYYNLRRGRSEKLIEELRTETALIKYKNDKFARENQFSGSFLARQRVSSMAPRGGKMDYRLKLILFKNWGDKNTLKLRLDTVDAGFNATTARDFATRLIDIESKFKFGGLNYKVNLGPGVVVHTEDNDFFASENYTIYIRPKTAVEVSSKLGKLDYSASYVTRQVQTSGLIGVHELTGKLKYKFNNMAVSFQPRYLFIIDGVRDILAEAGLNYMWNKNWITYVLWGVGDFKAANSGMYVKVIQKALDPFNTGTNVVLRVDKIGSRYRSDAIDKYEFCYLNNFNRLILDGTVDLGLKIDQKITDKITARWLSDYVTNSAFQYGADYPETYYLWQLGLSYKLSSSIVANTYYQSYNVPSGVAQFADTVPAVSEIIGFSLAYSF